MPYHKVKKNMMYIDKVRSSRSYKNSFGRGSKNTWYELPERFRKQMRSIIEERDGLYCSKKYGYGCGKLFKSTELSVDHIIPIRAGGPICDINNMQLLCFKCHEVKTITKDIVYSTTFKAVYRAKASSGTGRKYRPGKLKV